LNQTRDLEEESSRCESDYLEIQRAGGTITIRAEVKEHELTWLWRPFVRPTREVERCPTLVEDDNAQALNLIE